MAFSSSMGGGGGPPPLAAAAAGPASSADYNPAAEQPPVSPGNSANRVIKRRAPVACRRCRRMRSKCIHTNAKPPCESCRLAEVSLDECVFPTRGAPDLDREFRHPRAKGERARKDSGRSTSAPRLLHPAGTLPTPQALPADLWELLPPLEQIVDAVNMFTHQYFQLGFLPRRAFVQQLCSQPGSVSVFLLLGVLSVSARMTPSLVEAHGGPVRTAEAFMDLASRVALAELYQEPTLPRCQAFYLLSLAQQGSGYRNRSFVNLGIALRMAILMQLHREESYALDDPTPALVQKAESARRTMWMLYSQDNLHAGPRAPVSLAASDMTTLLPSNEDDFESGTLPQTRAALEDTQPARDNPALVSAPTRSLFATLMQSHQLWGCVQRSAVCNDRSRQPWDSASDYAVLMKKLSDWESRLPSDHLWSHALLRHYKAKSLDLAYVAVTMVTRLCNIVIRKAYIPNMLSEKQRRPFWKTMSKELFENARELFIQIDCWNQEREPSEGTGAQLAVFCVYSCGLMAAYLCKYPQLCPDPTITREGPHMLERTMDILSQSVNVWPLARRWIESVERLKAADQTSLPIGSSSHEGGMAEGKDPIPSALHPSLPSAAPSGPSNTPFDDRRNLARHLAPGSPHARADVSKLASGSVSDSRGGLGASTSSNGLPGSSAGHVPRHPPPQLRTTDSLLNPSMRLPPPLSQAQIRQQPPQQLSPAQPPPSSTLGAARPGVTGSLAAVPPTSVAPVAQPASLPLPPPLPPASQALADSRMSLMAAPDFGRPANSAADEAASVLVGGMMPHGGLDFGGRLPPSQPHPASAYAPPHSLADNTHLGEQDVSAFTSLHLQPPLLDFSPNLPDDGYQEELQSFFIPDASADGAWSQDMFLV